MQRTDRFRFLVIDETSLYEDIAVFTNDPGGGQ